MRVKFWGVRGSTPAPQPENMRYGGNTSCVEVRLNGKLYIFDCGTGFRVLGNQLRREFAGQSIFAHVFLSHFHWDHIQGLPFFAPLYESADNHFVFHSASRSRGAQRVMEDQMAPPYFPVGVKEMKAKRDFYGLEEGEFQLDNMTVKTSWLNHPQGCLGFRLETSDGVLVYATDNEPGDPLFDKNVRRLADGADVLIYDAQYLPEQYQQHRRGWGHSHWREAIRVVMESHAKELVLYHHDPEHDDACLDDVVYQARKDYARVRAASEGMEIVLGERP